MQLPCRQQRSTPTGAFFYFAEATFAGTTLAYFAVARLPSNRLRFRVVNFTMPARPAYSVSSPPRRTFKPGWILVPRWRMMMAPVLHRCPS